MAKREPDGNISLHEANQQARAADAAERKRRETAMSAAKAAVESAFKSPFERKEAHKRTQKNLRHAPE